MRNEQVNLLQRDEIVDDELIKAGMCSFNHEQNDIIHIRSEKQEVNE